jgi:hypothetical protein
VARRCVASELVETKSERLISKPNWRAAAGLQGFDQTVSKSLGTLHAVFEDEVRRTQIYEGGAKR